MEPVTARLQAAAIIFSVELISICVLILTPANHFYYMVCGGFNFAIICMLYQMPECALTFWLRRTNLFVLAIQFYGFLSYCGVALLVKYGYMVTAISWPIFLYNMLIHALNLLQIWIIFTKEAGDGYKRSRDRDSLLCDSYPHWAATVQKEKKCYTT